jgi:hypothetical protein
MNILHGRLHHLRMLAFMPIPFARSFLLAQVALLLCVLVIQTLRLPCVRLHGTSRASRTQWQPSPVNV